MTKHNGKLLQLPINTKGRDFIVGDIHGCFDELQYVLSKGLNFNPAVDRLLSVGDLIDRGPASMMCLDLMYEDWFYAVRGNHEQMMIDTILHDDRNMQATWYWNGGQWYAGWSDSELRTAALNADKLPLVITVGEGADRYNVVHADLLRLAPLDIYSKPGEQPIELVTDHMIDTWQFTKDDEVAMIWGRYIINPGPVPRQRQDPDNMSITFVGHTPGRAVVRAEQQIYLDTGAVYYHTGSNKSEQLWLSLACPQEKVVYMYNMMWKTIKRLPFDEIERV